MLTTCRAIACGHVTDRPGTHHQQRAAVGDVGVLQTPPGGGEHVGEVEEAVVVVLLGHLHRKEVAEGHSQIFGLTTRDLAVELGVAEETGTGAVLAVLRERRAHIDELRANLAESASSGDVASAIERLGPPRTLAAAVAGSDLRPSWMRGGIWVAATIMIGLFALVMSSSAFSTALPTDASVTWSTLLWTMKGTSAEGASSSFELDVPFTTVLLLLILFVLGARAWRLGTVRHGRSTN